MPFTEFRFLNSSNQPCSSTVVVGAAPPESTPVVQPKHGILQPVNPPIGPAQQINQAQVQQNPPLGPIYVLVAGPVISPDGSDFETIATVISEGIGPQLLCGVVARTMAGTQVYAELA